MRLFWKILLGYWMAWALLSAGMIGFLWLAQEAAWFGSSALSSSRPASFLVTNTATAVQFGGEDFFRRWAAAWPQGRGEPPYVVDAAGREWLGREVDATALEEARALAHPEGEGSSVKRVSSPEGEECLVFYPAGHGPGDRSIWRFLFEWPWLVGVVLALASLVFAGLLAASLARPISTLKAAFDAMSDGDLAARVGPQLARRHDELGELGRHFDTMASRLAHLVAAQKQLLHDVSHELRSPLARLGVAAALARQRPDRLGEALDRIERESGRLDRLVGEVLTLARLEAGAGTQFDDYVDLVDLLRVVVEDATFEAEAVSQEIRTRLPETGEWVARGNADLLHRSVENLVRNALQHAKNSRFVDVSLQKVDGPAAEIRVRDHGEEDGAGNDTQGEAAALAGLFQPFGRGPESRGFGLGLSIAQRTAVAHGGQIHARRHPEGGLEIVLTLPLTS